MMKSLKKGDMKMWQLMIGSSMKPAKPFIGWVNIKKQDKYEVGDIVAFKAKDRLFSKYCHRIIKINDNVFTTKGDNRVVIEDRETDVPLKNIIGKDCSRVI